MVLLPKLFLELTKEQAFRHIDGLIGAIANNVCGFCATEFAPVPRR
jgi:hypothetical protein